MRLNRPPGVASNPESAEGHRAGAGVVRVLSVTAVAVAVSAMGVLPAIASAAHSTKHSSETSVLAPKKGYTHTDIKLSATVKGPGETPTGTVTFWLGTKKLCRGTLSKGATSCEYKFSDPATKTITGRYSGNSTHRASSGTATIKIRNKPTTTPPPPPPPPPPGPSATTTTITNPPADVFATEPAGTPFTLSATVTAANGTVPTGTVEFEPYNITAPGPNVECLAAPLIDGTATCTVTPAVGTWGFMLYEAFYTPSNPAQYTGSNSGGQGYPEHKLITPDITTTTLTFSPSPATEADATTLTATVVTESGHALADAAGGPDLVTFSIGGVDIPGCIGIPVTDPSDGPDNVATCSYTPTAAGPVTILANYPGDLYAAASSDTETLTVDP